MKKLHVIPFIFIFFVSCNSNDKQEAANATLADSAKKENPRPELAYPVKYIDWELGDFYNLQRVVDMYKIWDEKKSFPVRTYFADTLRLRIPEVRKEFAVPNDKINEKLLENRAMYSSSTNDILSAVSLHDKASGQDWVMITTYSKWVEKDGTRDSVLYHDDWRLKNGKVDLLISFYKLPTREFLKSRGKQ